MLYTIVRENIVLRAQIIRFLQCCCVCYIGYVIEHNIHNIFIDLLNFFAKIKTIFCA